MLSYSELKKGTAFILDGEPYEVEDSQFVRMQQRKPVMQTKIKNLITGKVVSRNFHQNEVFHEADIVGKEMLFLFAHRGQYTFIEPGNPKDRVVLEEAMVGDVARFLKNNLPVTFLSFEEKIIGIRMPVKVEYLVKEATPADKGNTVQGATKEAILENGLSVQVPLFINPGDVVAVNTETGDYSERVEKK